MSSITELTLGDLTDELAAHAAHMSAGMCRYLELVAECERRGTGWDSTAEFLSWRCGLEPRSAREHVRVARALEELPLIHEAFTTGELSYSKVRALTRVGRPEQEDELLRLAQVLTASQLDRALRAYRRVMTDEAAEVQSSERLSFHWDDDGALVVRGRLAPEDGVLFLKALEVARERLWNDTPSTAARETGDRGSAEPRPMLCRPSNVDALVAVADASLAYEGAGRAGAEQYQVVIHVEQDALAEHGDGSCLLADGPAVAPETARRLACDTSIVTLLERAGEPLGVGRKTRKLPTALRRALEARDGCCRFPGCTNRRTHAHHIRHWAEGGETELTNLVLLCRRHHRLVHEGGWTVDHRLRFHNPFGILVPDAPSQPRASVDDLHHANADLAITAATHKTGVGDRMDLGLAVDHLLDIVARPTRWGSIADDALEGLAATLSGGPYPVEGLLRIGAVCNNPRHLVVRILLGTPAALDLPLDPHWLAKLRHDVRGAFAERDWPAATDIPVEFDSIAGAREKHWAYFGPDGEHRFE